MDLLTTVSFVIGVLVLIASWIAAVVIVKSNKYAGSPVARNASHRPLAQPDSERATREMASSTV